MWLLKSERGILFHIVAGKEHTVGRKDGSLVLSDDQSISRLHAKFFLASDTPNSEDGVKLFDLGSKYGTFINEGIISNEKIPANECKVMKHSDTIRFGLQWHKYTVICIPLVVVASSLNDQETAVVKNSIIELNGELSKVWSSNCTHFVMSAIKVSVKTVCALAAAIHIVKPAYFQALRDAINSRSADFPDPSDFVPESAETVLNGSTVSFLPDPRRSTLFDSLTFVVTTPRQMSRLGAMITSAGGKAVLFSESNLSKKDMCSRNVLLMQNSATFKNDSQMSLIPDEYPHFARYLTSNGYRCIPESDIGLSMVYCSIENFCNPEHNPMSSLLNERKEQNSLSSLPVIVPETQIGSSQDAGPSGVGKVINETMQSSATPRSTTKRLRRSSIEDEEEGTLKIKCGENQSPVRLSSKKLQVNAIMKKQNKNDDRDKNIDLSKKRGNSSKSCEDVSNVSTLKRNSLRNRSLKDMFASKSKTSIEEEESQDIEDKPPVIIENTIDKVDCIPESENLVIEECQSYSFNDYSKKTVAENKVTVRGSVDMFNCSVSSKNNDDNFTCPDVPKVATKKKDANVCEKSISGRKNLAESKSIDIFNSSVASTSASSTSMRRDVTVNDGDDFDFSDDDDDKGKRKPMSSHKSADMFGSSSAASTSVRHSSENEDFDFPDDDVNNRNNSKTRSNVKDSSRNQFGSPFTRKSKHNLKRDDFDFPDEEPSEPKRMRQSSIFSDSMFSDTKRVTVKRERTDSFDDDDESTGSRTKVLANGDRNVSNDGKICLSSFISREKKTNINREDQNENKVEIKVEIDDSDDENINLHNYSAQVIVMPMVKLLDAMNISADTTVDSNSDEVNFKRFKKNKIAGYKKLPKIVKVSFIACQNEEATTWPSSSSESEDESEDDFDFGETQGRKTNKRVV